MNREEHTRIIKEIAADVGFQFCGISKAGFLEEEAPRLEKWLKQNYHGEMSYMENHFDKRLDPTLLVPGTKSVVSLLLNYYPGHFQRTDTYKISKYAYGEDYHEVIKKKLFLFFDLIKEKIGNVEGRVFVDSAPVMDKVWAAKGGLGWRGKNGNLINPKKGSFFFIAELLLDLDLIPDGPLKDYCGTCTRCMDACPTDALNTPYVVDGSRCISYLTIELRNENLPQEFEGKMDNWMFGCDVCQDVCPWNRFSLTTLVDNFRPKTEAILGLDKKEWEELNEDAFQQIFKKSAVKRTKYSGLKRNIAFLSKLEDNKDE